MALFGVTDVMALDYCLLPPASCPLPSATSNAVDCAATSRGSTDTSLAIGVKSRFIVDRNFFTRLDISQSNKENVFVKDLHERIWLTRMIDVVGSVSASTTVQTPAVINSADPQRLSFCSSVGLGV